jgi:hypothetical protein
MESRRRGKKVKEEGKEEEDELKGLATTDSGERLLVLENGRRLDVVTFPANSHSLQSNPLQFSGRKSHPALPSNSRRR